MGENTRLGVISGLLIGLLLLLLVIGDFSFFGLAAVLVASLLTGLIVWIQLKGGATGVSSRDEDEDEDEEYALDESLDERLGTLFRDTYADEDEDVVEPLIGDDFPSTELEAGLGEYTDRSEPLFDSQTFEEPSGVGTEDSSWATDRAEPEPQPFNLSDLRRGDNGSAPPVGADDTAEAVDPLAAYEEEFRSDSSVTSFDDLRMPRDADRATSSDDFMGSPEPPEPITNFDDLRAPRSTDDAADDLDSFLRRAPEPAEPAPTFDDLRMPPDAEAAPPLEDFRTPGAGFEEPAPVADTELEADEDIFADSGVIDEEKVDSDETILGAAHASSLGATLTEEEANVETREILGRVAALLEKYE